MSETRPADRIPLPGGSFRLFLQRLGYQGLMSLGLVENPLTDAREVRLESARMLIDDLLMLREKTEGNLDGDEAAHLRKLIGDLELVYEGVSRQEGREEEREEGG